MKTALINSAALPSLRGLLFASSPILGNTKRSRLPHVAMISNSITTRKNTPIKEGFRKVYSAFTILLLLLFSCARFVAAQSDLPLSLDPDKALTQFSHDVWQDEQGLPQNAVQAFAQTPDGYLWLGLEEGLARFDGVQFRVFNEINVAAIQHDNIWVLLVDHAGRLWIGTRGGGLNCYSEGNFTQYAKREGLAHEVVFALHEDARHNLWIGTNGGGLSRLQDGKFTTYTVKDGLASNIVTALACDHDNNLWIGTENNGLSVLKEGGFSNYNTQHGLADNNITALFHDPRGIMWLGTAAGFVRAERGSFTTFTMRDGLAHNSVKALAVDRAGSLWIGTYGGGLSRFARGAFSNFSTREGLSSDFIRALYEDREGSLWIGTYGGGVTRLRESKFATIARSSELPNDMVWCVREDESGALWIGTDKGLHRYNHGKMESATALAGISQKIILALHQSREGALWVGTEGSGLYRLQHGRLTHYTIADGLSHHTVRALHEDRDGNLWIGTNQGVNILPRAGLVALHKPEALSHDRVPAIYEDRRGRIWLGTGQSGLYCFAENRFTVYTVAEGLSSNFVRAFYEDEAGALWIGTRGGGLNRFKDGKFTNYTVKQGLFDDVVFQILPDEQGRLWMSCNKGVFHVGLNELNAFAEGRRARVTCTVYGKADGMKSNECNGGSQPAGWKTRDGKLYFPTIRGVAVIDPSHIRTNPVPPPVVIEEVLVNHRAATLEAPVKFPPGSDNLEFHYTGLSLLAPARVQFKYKLEGFEEDWNDAGTRRTAYYTNVAPGDYTFRVSASNNDGVWNENAAALQFKLKPYFYQTKLFYFACALALLASAAGAYKLRVRRITKRHRELAALNEQLEQRVRERTYELQDSEERLRQIAENIDEVLWIEARDQRGLLYVSPSYEKVWGRTCASLYEQPGSFLESVLPEDRELFKAHLQKQRHGEFSEMEYRIVRPDGAVRWVWDRSFPIQNSKGAIYRTAGMAEDITERMHAENALRQSEALKGAILNAALDAIITIDHEGKVLEFNPAAEKIFGYPRSEVLGRALVELIIPPCYREQHQRGMARYLATGETKTLGSRLEFSALRANGAEFPIELTVSRISAEEPPKFTAFLRDITQRKELQEQLRQHAEELEKLVAQRAERIQELERQRAENEKVAAAGRLAARIAHEINNPLGGIKNSFMLVKDAIKPDHPYFHYVGRIEKEIDRIARIVRQTFELNKPDQELRRQFKVEEAIHEIMSILEPSRREHGVKFEFEPAGAPLVVNMSEGLLRQILFNLLQNALEASPPGSTIKVSAELLGSNLRLAVADHGRGIPEELRSRIFEPFFTTKSGLLNSGIGLGLSVSKNIVDAMKGALTFESEEGKGTVFKIRLPVWQP